jgi:hypothetical protein
LSFFGKKYGKAFAYLTRFGERKDLLGRSPGDYMLLAFLRL